MQAPKDQTADPSIAALMALQLAPGAGYVTVNAVAALMRHQGVSLPALLGQPAGKVISALPPGCDALGRKIAACTEDIQAEARRQLEVARAHDFAVLLIGGPGYPEVLAETLGRNAPPVLFVAGHRSLLDDAPTGIVGTRQPTSEGVFLAEACAETFAEAGVSVVSGGAPGIDTAAQEAALDAGGRVIVVLPQGLLRYAPTAACQAGLDQGRVVLLSEFMPGAAWQTHAAVTRNATISALSRILCLIEPGRPNGSLLTARHALAQGKPVFYSHPNAAGQWLDQCREAHPLRDAQGRFRRGQLLRAWKAARPRGARQPELL